MLNQWLLEGVINDPFDEFMIRENEYQTPLWKYFKVKVNTIGTNCFN